MTTEQQPEDWRVRLGRHVRARRQQLKMSQQDVAIRGGPSTATLYLIEADQAPALQRGTKERLDSTLGWAIGSTEAIIRGGEPEMKPWTDPRHSGTLDQEPAEDPDAAAFDRLDRRSIGKAITGLMLLKDISFEEMARQLNVSPLTLRQALYGHTIRVEHFESIWAGLRESGFSVQEMLDRDSQAEAARKARSEQFDRDMDVRLGREPGAPRERSQADIEAWQHREATELDRMVWPRGVDPNSEVAIRAVLSTFASQRAVADEFANVIYRMRGELRDWTDLIEDQSRALRYRLEELADQQSAGRPPE
jgi:transcriptional regulator with XRE-family HTH domain